MTRVGFCAGSRKVLSTSSSPAPPPPLGPRFGGLTQRDAHQSAVFSNFLRLSVVLGNLGARPQGRRTTHASKKDWEKVLGRVLGKGFQKGS